MDPEDDLEIEPGCIVFAVAMIVGMIWLSFQFVQWL